MALGAIYFFFLKNFLRPIPAKAAKPEPSNNMVAGSGTGLVSSLAESFSFVFHKHGS
jgi:hypothetical protein